MEDQWLSCWARNLKNEIEHDKVVGSNALKQASSIRKNDCWKQIKFTNNIVQEKMQLWCANPSQKIKICWEQSKPKIQPSVQLQRKIE